MRERIGYSNFINKYGRIIFPVFFGCLLIFFSSPITYDNWFVKMGLIPNVMQYSFYCFIPQIVTAPIYYLKTNYEEMSSYYSSFQVYLEDVLPSFALSIAMSIFAITIICCIIAFLVLYFAKHKANKGLIISIPSLYLVMTIVFCIATKGTPFVGFYLTLVFLILAIMYCANAQLLPKPRTPREHKPTKDERIAELERQVAELKKDKDAE